jgi:hypothetical protein
MSEIDAGGEEMPKTGRWAEDGRHGLPCLSCRIRYGVGFGCQDSLLTCLTVRWRGRRWCHGFGKGAGRRVLARGGHSLA